MLERSVVTVSRRASDQPESTCLLVGNTLQRFFIIEPEISGMDYVVRACLLSKLIERFEIAYNPSSKLRRFVCE